MNRIEDAILDILEEEEPIKTTGTVKAELLQRGLAENLSYGDVHDILEELRGQDKVELAHGEWNEYRLK